MSVAATYQVGPARLPKASRKATRKLDSAVAKQTGEMSWSTPLQALAEARMRKAQIEIACQHRSCGASPRHAGKEKPAYLVELGTRIATRLSSLVQSLTHAGLFATRKLPAARISVHPAELHLPLRAELPKRIEALFDPRSCHADPSAIRMCAQGDILIERVDDAPGDAPQIADADVVILAEGELSGHRHSIHGRVRFFHDAALARDIPRALYVGHFQVKGSSARLEHDEHDAITLQTGIYRVRRQRRLEPSAPGLVAE